MALVRTLRKCSAPSFLKIGSQSEINSLNNNIFEKILPFEEFVCINGYVIIEPVDDSI